MEDKNNPITGCKGCSTTGGRISCPIHGNGDIFTVKNLPPSPQRGYRI